LVRLVVGLATVLPADYSSKVQLRMLVWYDLHAATLSASWRPDSQLEVRELWLFLACMPHLPAAD
jgi:hypothetical protein